MDRNNTLLEDLDALIDAQILVLDKAEGMGIISLKRLVYNNSYELLVYLSRFNSTPIAAQDKAAFTSAIIKFRTKLDTYTL